MSRLLGLLGQRYLYQVGILLVVLEGVQSGWGASYSFVLRWCASLCHLLAPVGNLVGLACQIGSKRPKLYPGTRFYLGLGGLATQNTQNLSMVTAILNY